LLSPQSTITCNNHQCRHCWQINVAQPEYVARALSDIGSEN
jgi:hypothetical protein